MKRFSLRRPLVALALGIAFFSQETWTLAGVTGNLAGNVRDNTGAPVAAATVQALSPSQTATTTTDAQGHFIFLALAPDTYTINISKSGYQRTAFPGNVVFADQTQQSTFTVNRSLKVIASVSSQSAGSLVKSGVGGDLYSVNSAQAAAAAALGGGGNLNSAYSALASVPGVQVNVGGLGWTFNASYIRGQDQYYTGYEYDGIPVNRAFDNYNASTESSLGLQELQVYTGGGPSSVASAGTSGFVNQVIKTGTFPGYASAQLGIGTPTYYHQAQVEIGGATPDRNFSWYAGFSGYNQTFRFLDQSNGASLLVPNGQFSGPTLGAIIGYTATPSNFFTGQGVKPSCPLGAPPPTGLPAGCWEYYNGISAFPSMISDREDVINVHFGIPRQNGLRDDIQALWSASALNNQSYSSISDIGTSPNQFYWALFHAPYAGPVCGQMTVVPWAGVSTNACTFSKAGAYLPYADQIVYNVPFGTPIASSATNFRAPTLYYAPDTPPHAFDGPINNYDESISPYQNDTGIVKLQYTHALSTAAYLRAYGYTFYSDWMQTSPIFGATGEATPAIGAPQYDLFTHTSGAALNFNDQLNDQNLVTADYNYTTANVARFNNDSAVVGGGTTPIGYMAKNNCYSPTSGAAVPCIVLNPLPAGETCAQAAADCYYDVATKSLVNPPWVSDAATGPTGFAHGGATWNSLWDGEVTGSLNNVRPQFQNASLSDQWRPNDKFLVNASIRYDDFTYILPDSTNAADSFYAGMVANYTCVQAATNQVLLQPLPPGVPPPANAQYVAGDCNQAAAALAPAGPHTGWVHPNGKIQDGVAAPNFTASSPGSYSLDYWEPRFSATYTESRDAVWRVSAGRYTQPPLSAAVQYLGASGDDRSVWTDTMGLGFYSPFHPIPGVSAAQYDLSYERHLAGTDMSFKVTPFYTWVTGYQQSALIGAGFITSVPVGVNRNQGVEFQFTKGDFTRNGLSGQFSFTYTNAQIRFEGEPLSSGGVVPNSTATINQAIAQYNLLTKAGGGSACYRAGLPARCNAPPVTIDGTTYDTILNPYYNQPSQGELDPNGWYAPYTIAIAPNENDITGTFSYISPYVASAIVNYRQGRLAITPSLQWQAGGYYGNPLDINGYDPRACTLNSGHTGIIDTNPLQCNITTLYAPGLGALGYLYIPDPQTGHFAGLNSYENPSILTGNLQVTYEVTQRVKLTVTGTNIFQTCFGGTAEPWTAVYAPSPNVCGYTPAGGVLNNSLYPSNFYNGTGIGDVKANKTTTVWTQSYVPSTLNNGGIGASLAPFNVYFNAQIKV
jgi:hypothetical protein